MKEHEFFQSLIMRPAQSVMLRGVFSHRHAWYLHVKSRIPDKNQHLRWSSVIGLHAHAHASVSVCVCYRINASFENISKIEVSYLKDVKFPLEVFVMPYVCYLCHMCEVLTFDKVNYSDSIEAFRKVQLSSLKKKSMIISFFKVACLKQLNVAVLICFSSIES